MKDSRQTIIRIIEELEICEFLKPEAIYEYLEHRIAELHKQRKEGK